MVVNAHISLVGRLQLLNRHNLIFLSRGVVSAVSGSPLVAAYSIPKKLNQTKQSTLKFNPYVC